jgi:hypothetical protein
MNRARISGAAILALVVGWWWCGVAAAQCGGGGGGSMAEMKKMMGPMKDVTMVIVEAGQKLGEKKPDDKEAKFFETNARKLGMMNKRLFTMLSDPMCKQASAKLNKGVADLIKCAGKKDSNGIADGISQIRATCGECHNCPGL